MSIQQLCHRAGLHTAAAMVLLALGVPVETAADAQETETVDRTAAIAPGGTLTLNNFAGRVRISGSDRRDVSIHAVRRAPRERLDRVKLEVRSSDGNVTIEANKRDDDRSRENVVETDLTIETPRNVNLRVTVFSSDVELRDLQGGEHRVKSFSGDLQIEGVTGSLVAETFDGNVHASPSITGGQECRFTTFSGDIELRVTAAAAAVEFDTFSGRLDSDVPLTMRARNGRTIRAHLGGTSDSGRLHLKTFSGDVRLLK
jgi:DUF4097 and DUF4098 domain-containing protein YvlB